MAEAPQRIYSAPCPGCGAAVEFRSAQSTHAVCAYCQSTVVRQGETLARIGKMAELFDDFSPLQLMATGRLEQRAFTLVGRLQYKYAVVFAQVRQAAVVEGRACSGNSRSHVGCGALRHRANHRRGGGVHDVPGLPVLGLDPGPADE